MEESKDELKKYEISLIIKTEETAESVFALIKNQGMEVLEKKPLQKTKLAYPIKKETGAFFLTVVVELLPEKVAALDHELKLLHDVLRFLIITPPIEKEERSERPQRFSKPKSELPKKLETHEEPVMATLPAEPEVQTNELLEKKLEEILG